MAIPLRVGREAARVNARLAMRAGAEAYLAGEHLTDCPYPTIAERIAWREGWEDAQLDEVLFAVNR